MTQSRTYAPHENAAARADTDRIRAELRDRLDRLANTDVEAFERALRNLAHTDPDAVNQALDEEEAGR